MTRRGITAVELLVSLSIIALLIAIIVPAVMSARESSRRMQCRSNLAQFGRALHAYEAAHRQFPAAVDARPTDRSKGVSHHSYAPHVLLLPHLDQAALHQQLDVSQPQPSWADLDDLRPLAQTTIPVFLCPSDAGTKGTNYRVCMGPHVGCWDGPDLAETQYGPFAIIDPRTPQQFKDGLSNTVAMSEKLESDGDAGFSTGDFWYTGYNEIISSYPTTGGLLSVCSALTATPTDYYDHAGWSWLVGCYEFTWYNHVLPPNPAVIDCSSQVQASNTTSVGVYSATSHHAGGVNCLFMDGSVKFIADQIDAGVWGAVATRDGGDAVGGIE